MVLITESLIRKRAEHNNCELASLEEVSLHQMDIERIEHIDKWCRELKILYLQSNLIPRIENVSRLKQLEYLNLALNNVHLIENLEGCEFLNKLDLTLNFVGKLTSVESLSCNTHFRELHLVGNPCTKYEDYRGYIAAVLPQLVTLDGIKIERSERLKACQDFYRIRGNIVEQETAYAKERELEKKEEEDKWCKEVTESDPMDEPIKYTPESRVAMHKHMEEKRKPQKEEPKRYLGESTNGPRRLERDGRRLNINEAKYKFALKDDSTGIYRILEVECPKFMDTSLITCDVQPYYIHVTLKGKILQLAFDETDAVHPDQSKAERCQTSGSLVVKMKRVTPTYSADYIKEMTLHGEQKMIKEEGNKVRREYLEVDPKARHMPSLDCMTTDRKKRKEKLFLDDAPLVRKGVSRNDFIDDPDVPPLM